MRLFQNPVDFVKGSKVMVIKRIASFVIFFCALSALYGQSSANPLAPLDNAVKNLASEIRQKIPAGGSPKIALGQWIRRDSVPVLGVYWAAQLTEELANIPGRSFTLVSGGAAAADWIVSGEIVEAAAVIRVYTRLVRSGDHSIAASFHADIDFTDHLAVMLSNSGDGRGALSSAVRDIYEPDSMENPLPVNLATHDNGPVISRTIHTENDEDFFLLTPDMDCTLILETTGNTDTYMELYDAASGDKLGDNDDGGSGMNARIRFEARSGKRYIVKIRGYGGDVGNYGLQIRIAESSRMPPDEYEDDDDFVSARDIPAGTVQPLTFTAGAEVTGTVSF
jgi:hypothetical protein